MIEKVKNAIVVGGLVMVVVVLVMPVDDGSKLEV
jgi:hypothetical protein